jgi:hypothetical protein
MKRPWCKLRYGYSNIVVAGKNHRSIHEAGTSGIRGRCANHLAATFWTDQSSSVALQFRHAIQPHPVTRDLYTHTSCLNVPPFVHNKLCWHFASLLRIQIPRSITETFMRVLNMFNLPVITISVLHYAHRKLPQTSKKYNFGFLTKTQDHGLLSFRNGLSHKIP